MTVSLEDVLRVLPKSGQQLDAHQIAKLLSTDKSTVNKLLYQGEKNGVVQKYEPEKESKRPLWSKRSSSPPRPSPSQKRKRTPSPSPSPPRKRSPARKRSPSPARKRSPSPARKRLPSPARKRSPPRSSPPPSSPRTPSPARTRSPPPRPESPPISTWVNRVDYTDRPYVRTREDIIAIAKEVMTKHIGRNLDIKFTPSHTKAAASVQAKVINGKFHYLRLQMNLESMRKISTKELRETLIHEMAHVIRDEGKAYKKQSWAQVHNKEWFDICKRLGGTHCGKHAYYIVGKKSYEVE